MKSKSLTPILGFALAICSMLHACKEQPVPDGAGGPSEPPQHADQVHLSPEAVARYGVKVEPATKHVLQPTLLAPARVSFNIEGMAHVGSPLPGRVIELKVKLGDTVKQGEPMLVIESPTLGEAQSDYLQKRAAANAAGPAAELVKNAHERAKALYERSQGIALAEVQKREAEYRAAQAALLSAQAAAIGAESKLHLFGMDHAAVELLTTTGEVAPRFAITAPIAGQVISREVTLGELVSPEKEALLVLANMDTLWVLADVPEARLSEIAIGAPVHVTVGTGAGAEFNGTVAFSSPTVDSTTRSAQVRIEVRGAQFGLRAGMFAQVEIELGTTADSKLPPVLAVPDEAVQTIEGKPSVFLPVAGDASAFVKRSVKVGRAIRGLVPVLEGLEEGESIVVAGSFILKAELGKGSAGEE